MAKRKIQVFIDENDYKSIITLAQEYDLKPYQIIRALIKMGLDDFQQLYDKGFGSFITTGKFLNKIKRIALIENRNNITLDDFKSD